MRTLSYEEYLHLTDEREFFEKISRMAKGKDPVTFVKGLIKEKERLVKQIEKLKEEGYDNRI